MRARTLVCFVWLLAGCGARPVVEVTGTVALDGAPIELGSIVFVPVAGGAPVGGQIQNGKYRLVAPQVPVGGEYKVEVRSSQNSNRAPAPGAKPPPAEAVAARFNARTELKARVGPAGGTHDFQVSSK